MLHISDYLKSNRAKGHYSFTTKQAVQELRISLNALKCGVYKLKKKGEIISPAKGLYVIVPPEYQSIGSLPADELILILMEHWNLPYYICLLSAAVFHGASHQKPQVFQVMTNKQIKPLIIGKVRIEFIYKRSLKDSVTKDVPVKLGYLKVATPETTTIDLLLYPHRAGGLNHIATVLSELIEAVDPNKLMEMITNVQEKSCIQRLGYLLENIETDDEKKQKLIVTKLKKYLSKNPPNYILLAPEVPAKACKRNNDWKIVENTTIESDL